MQQVVLFHRKAELGQFEFEAGRYYTFQIKEGPFDKCLCYQGQELINLSLFANYFTDQGHAEWIDDPVEVGAVA